MGYRICCYTVLIHFNDVPVDPKYIPRNLYLTGKSFGSQLNISKISKTSTLILNNTNLN